MGNILGKIIDCTKLKICQKNYNNVLVRLNKKINNNEPLNVVFIVSENQKWGYQSLYDLFKDDKHFKPLVLINLHRDIHKRKIKRKPNISENVEFFKQKGLDFELLYEDKKYKNLFDFNPDIVFYDQQWGLIRKYKPFRVSKYALCCFIPYGFSILAYKGVYNKRFHRYLFKYFIMNKDDISRVEGYQKGNSNNCELVGYSKLDTYINDNNIDKSKLWKNPDNKKIIYSPHHSFAPDSLKMATFNKNGRFILDYAKNNPDTSWVFKPHPCFYSSVLKNKIMTKKELDDYYGEWAKIGKVYEQGDYFDIFKTSDLMITDCCSFLGEYYPTLKPLIRLSRADSTPLNSTGEKIVDNYYEVFDNEELIKIIDKIIKKNEDEKFEKRKELFNKFINSEISTAQKIKDSLLNSINGVKI